MRAEVVLWGWGRDGKGQREHSGLMEVPPVYAFVKIDQTIQLRSVHSTTYKLYPNFYNQEAELKC